MRANLPDKNYFLGKAIPGNETYKIAEHHGSGFNAHVFRAFSEELQNSVACKIIPRSNLSTEVADWRQEAQKPNSLNHPSIVKVFGTIEWKDPSKNIDCVGFVSEFIGGRSLKEYIRINKKKIEIGFTESLLRTLFEVLFEAGKKNISHGDLHSGNILVEEPNEYQLNPATSFRVTDFAVGSFSSEHGARDDFDQLAMILHELLENFNYQSGSARDKFAFNVLNDHFLARHLTERDLTIDPIARRPRELHAKIQGITQSFNERKMSTEKTTLATPFDYLSCEQIGDAHSLLKALYSDRFLGLGPIESHNNLVITGPRGCGKSTVFRSLSLWHKLIVGDTSINEKRYLGVYYRCDDMYYGFPRYKEPGRTEAVDLPMHFLTATLLAEVLKTINELCVKNGYSEFEQRQKDVSRKLWEALAIKIPNEPNALTFSFIISQLQNERKYAVEKQRFANDPKHDFHRPLFGPSVLPNVCNVLTQEFLFLSGKCFFYFIDDYSSPKITLTLQKSLNRLLMQRTSSCFFKISTESSISYSRSDIDEKNYVEGREFMLLDLGMIYLSEDKESKLAFLEDVFARRFRAIEKYPVRTLGELVGSNPGMVQNEIARSIRDHQKPEWWGKEVLAELCSGDIHYIISLVARMVTDFGGVTQLAQKHQIPASTQTKVIRDQAGIFLSTLRGSFKDGGHVVDVVTAFGNVAHSFLMYRTSKNESNNPPHQASRIEPYDELKLSPDAERIYNELLRYSVFIEDRRGKSRRGNVVPRLHLRRFLIPFFNLTFSGRDSIPLEPGEIEQLLVKPTLFEERKRLKAPEEQEDVSDNPQTRLDI